METLKKDERSSKIVAKSWRLPFEHYISIYSKQLVKYFACFQFAGGFDAESMKAFEDLRGRVSAQTGENKLEA